jgi:tol-pal system protein YbgF
MLAMVFALAVLAACSDARIEKVESDIGQIHEEVSDIRRGQAAQRVQFDAFRNRLVMLQDKFESQRVSAARRAARNAIGSGSRISRNGRPDVIELPRLPRVVVPAAKPKVELPEANKPAPKSVTIGPDGIVRVAVKKTAKKRNRSKTRSASKRARKAAKRPAGPRGTNQGRTPHDGMTPDEVAAGKYRLAKQTLDEGDLGQARTGFESFLRGHPAHTLADNALYWIGETWYAQAMWLKAARSFGQVVGRYPRGNKVPDAMLKTGLCYRKVGEDAMATDVFRQVRKLYPGTSAANLAKRQLDTLGSR